MENVSVTPCMTKKCLDKDYRALGHVNKNSFRFAVLAVQSGERYARFRLTIKLTLTQCCLILDELQKKLWPGKGITAERGQVQPSANGLFLPVRFPY
jgi:hypothetical protein